MGKSLQGGVGWCGFSGVCRQYPKSSLMSCIKSKVYLGHNLRFDSHTRQKTFELL